MVMEEIDRELLKLLTTKIGMLMEDRSSQALFLGAEGDDEHTEALNEVANAAEKINALARAAQLIAG